MRPPSDDGLLHFDFAPRQQFKQTVAQPWPAREPQPPVQLGAGERATITTPVRAQSIEADWTVPLLQALTSGGCAALLSIGPTVFIKWIPWYTPLVVWPTVAGGAWFVVSKAARDLLMLVEEFTGQDIDGDGVIGESEINIHTTIHENGGTRHNTITIPVGMARSWRNFCQAVIKRECNFSATAAADKGVDPVIFKRIVDVWVSDDPQLTLIDPKTVGPRKTMHLVERGWQTVQEHSTLSLPRLSALLESETGADR